MESPAPPYRAETGALNTHYTSDPGETLSIGHPEDSFGVHQLPCRSGSQT